MLILKKKEKINFNFVQFQVPQFIEAKAKIVGPLNFQQFVFFLIAGGISFAVYFLMPRAIFFLVFIFSFGIAAAFAFLKIEGRPLVTVIYNYFFFSLATKLYLWKKKEIIFAFKEKAPEKIELAEKKEELQLKIAEKSRLKKIRTKIELS
ncbi:MAG: PrgI family protein [bacterium]|nr:PrgI family protein [bacterium]